MNFDDNKKYNNIILWRSILHWGWYQDIPTKTVFIHCLLRANYKDGVWNGINYKRGQFITSYKTLANETGLSEQQVRTAIKHLKLTQELTQTSTKRYTLITVNNYDVYQSVSNTKSNKQKTHHQHTDNIQLTTDTLININNTNNINNIGSDEQTDFEDDDEGWIDP